MYCYNAIAILFAEYYLHLQLIAVFQNFFYINYIFCYVFVVETVLLSKKLLTFFGSAVEVRSLSSQVGHHVQ